ncbi:MAG: restriction endonuclease [Epsilonproteobacteria bacterium]|nr:restriction endonuclease [Campylobacterota bacterium]NPA64631.1 McrC family protein [Campylobacterota bacterium]
MTTIQVLEHQPIHAPRYKKELEELAKRSQFLSFDRSGEVIAQNFVGILRTKGGLTLEVLPKVGDLENKEQAQEILLKMLRVLPDFPIKSHLSAALAVKRNSLLEFFIWLFVQEVQRVVKKGLKHDYIQKEENLHFLKGKLLIHEQLKRNYIHKERFFVRYDEYMVDRLENRAIKEALLIVKKLSRSLQNQKSINELLFVFDEVSRLKNPKAVQSHKLDRTMQYYEEAIAWAKLFLLGYSPQVSGGEFGVWSLLFDMNRLFERYVGVWLKRMCDSIKLQDQSFYLFDEPKIGRLRPDIVIGNEIVIDTKWKNVDKFEDISPSDLYQLFAYAAKYPNVKRAILLFPSFDSKESPLESFKSKIGNREVEFCFDYFNLKNETQIQNLCTASPCGRSAQQDTI